MFNMQGIMQYLNMMIYVCYLYEIYVYEIHICLLIVVMVVVKIYTGGCGESFDVIYDLVHTAP